MTLYISFTEEQTEGPGRLGHPGLRCPVSFNSLHPVTPSVPAPESRPVVQKDPFKNVRVPEWTDLVPSPVHQEQTEDRTETVS